MKEIYIIFLIILSIFLSSCSFNKFQNFFNFGFQEDEVKKSAAIDEPKKSCPKTIIPKETSEYLKKSYDTVYTAKIKKIKSSCIFNTLKNNSDKEQVLISFQAEIELLNKNKLPFNKISLKQLNLYIAIVNDQGNVMAKLLAPIVYKDLKDNKNNVYKVFKTKKFKYNYNNNETFFIYYGFQQNSKNLFRN
tara:strand:- start:54 stop:626 length:573 start_codon:yes stop_codon:yes gene_type:complete